MSLAPVQLNTLLQQVADLTRARWSDMPLLQVAVHFDHNALQK